MFEFIGGLRYTEEERDWTRRDLHRHVREPRRGATRAAHPGCRSCRFPTAIRARVVHSISRPQSRRTRSTSRPCSSSGRTTTRCTTLSVSEAFRSGGYSSAVIFSQDALEPYGPETLTPYEIGSEALARRQPRALQCQRVLLRLRGLPGDLRARRPRRVRGCRMQATSRSRASRPPSTGCRSTDSDAQRGAQPARYRDRRDGRGSAAARRRAGLHHRGQRDPERAGRLVQRPAPLREAGERHAGDRGPDRLQLRRRALPRAEQSRVSLPRTAISLANARVSLLPQDGPWQVSAWVKNLGGRGVPHGRAGHLALSLGFSEIVLGVPLTWGVDFEYRF